MWTRLDRDRVSGADADPVDYGDGANPLLLEIRRPRMCPGQTGHPLTHKRLSDQLNQSSPPRWTSADTHGRPAAGQACYGAGVRVGTRKKDEEAACAAESSCGICQGGSAALNRRPGASARPPALKGPGRARAGPPDQHATDQPGPPSGPPRTAPLAAVQGERYRGGCVVAGERVFRGGSGCGRVAWAGTGSAAMLGRLVAFMGGLWVIATARHALTFRQREGLRSAKTA